MPEEPLQLRLEQTDRRPGQFTLTCNTWHYPVMLNSERDVALNEWLRRLQPVLIGNADPSGDLAPQELMRNVGIWLWHALLPKSAPAQEREALAHALRSGRTPLLLELPTALSGLPWELLCDPQQPAEQGFLARRRPLLRFIASGADLPSVTPPLRVLLLISSPPSLGEDARVDVESERATVELATRELREAGLLHLFVEDIVTQKRVQQALMHFKPHMVHYIGHGGYSEVTGGTLLWEDEQGKPFFLSAERLVDLLRPRNIAAVILHACQTGRSNARTDVPGMAGTLVREGIPVVLAQQANFTYESSQRASEAWYTALASGQRLTDALFEVRQALWLADRPDWAVPLLYANSASLTPLLESSTQAGAADPLLSIPGVIADLPAPTCVFVGRHREMCTLHLMLESASGRGPVMALITGPGGIGKSTLAAQAVIRYGRAYKGALTLRCQEYTGLDLFLLCIGEFLKRLSDPGFLEQILPDPKLRTEAKIEEAIAALNLAGPLLLVFDNLESVQAEDQTLRDDGLLYLLQKLLTNLRGGRVLITGRYAVKNLLPQGKFAASLRHLDLDDLSPYETNQLLLQHDTLAHLGKIVRQKLITEFGGLPMVYDLLSKDANSQSLALLIHDMQGRITEERQQRSAQEWQKVRRQVVEFAALEAIIKSLSESARMLLGQLSVLLQPFPLAAMEQGLDTERAAWQPLLDRSLLRYDQEQQSYHLHSLTRRYAEETLLDAQERRQAQEQLANWYERYADQKSHDLADYLEAHRLLRAAGKVQQAGNLVVQQAEILSRCGLYPRLRDLCTKTLDDIGESDALLKANTLRELGNIALLQGEYIQARHFYQQSLDLFELLGDQHGRAGSLLQLGNIAQELGEYNQALHHYQQSLDLFEGIDDQRGRANSLHQLGSIAFLQGEYVQARHLTQQSLDLFEQLGDQNGRATSLHQLGSIAALQGEYVQTRHLTQQSLDLFGGLGDQRGRANSLHQLGSIALSQGEYVQARHLTQQCLDLFGELGHQRGRATSLFQLGKIAYLQGECVQARHLTQQSLDLFGGLGDQRGRANSLLQLGSIAFLQGEYAQARHLTQQCLNLFERLGDQNGRANSLHQLGSIALLQGEYAQARHLYQQSLDLFELLGDQSGCANSLGQFGLLAYSQGDFENALRYTILAYILFDALQFSPSRVFAQRQIAKIRNHMNKATFITYWRKLAGDRPLPPLFAEETQQFLRQIVIDFINTPMWEASKYFLKAHPELLQLETDVLLQQWVTQQVQDDHRKKVEECRLLFAQCREKGIDIAFAEFQAAQVAQSTPPDEARQQEEGNHD